MIYKKFQKGDFFYNTIKTRPRFEFKLYGGKVYLNNQSGVAEYNNLLITPPVLEAITGCTISLDFSCIDNSQYIPVLF